MLPMAGTAALFVLSAEAASAQFAERGGEVVIPGSSTEAPEHIGVKAHTNFRYFVAKAGKASEQFAHEVAPEQTGGPPFSGYLNETPASLACVYKLVSNPVVGCNPNDPALINLNPSGGSHAIAIVDAYDYPTATQDLTVFSAQFNLPLPNTPSFHFQVVYANGRKPPVNANWNVEEALDVQWAHAMAPNAKIYLVEAASASYSDLLTAVSRATSLVQSAGGGEVSMSWGGSEFFFETVYDSYFNQKGVVYFAAAGDSPGVIWPSVSSFVVSAGGTSISRNLTTGAFQEEVTWQSGGGGPSVYEKQPSYQSGVSALVGSQRGTPDVAADANPTSGVWVYDSPYWYMVGGTSVAAPVWAGIVNAASTLPGRSFSSSSQTELTNIYKTLGTPAYAADFNDITTSTCGPSQGYIAASGWDSCTGLGSPLGQGGK
jgi:subtilase family serine protease